MANQATIAAAIDIGTNSFRLLVSEIIGDKLKPLVKKLETVRLGKGMTGSNFLSQTSIELGLKVLSSFVMTVASYKPVFCRACGTEALRRAANSAEFLRKAAFLLGDKVEIISGEQEATMTYLGVASHLDLHTTDPVLIVDVGGGSMELVWVKDQKCPFKVSSLPIGVVGLTEDFLHNYIPTSLELFRLRQFIKDKLEEFITDGNRSNFSVIGSGGTATALAALDLGLKKYDEKLVHGHLLNTFQLAEHYKNISTLSARRRNLLPGLDHGRGDIILAGIIIYQELLQIMGIQYIQVSDTGLLEGILLDKIRS